MRSVRNELDHVVAMGDVASALKDGGRRRRRRRIAVVSMGAAVALLTVALVPSMLSARGTFTPTTVDQSADRTPSVNADGVITVEDTIRTWVPAVQVVGTPAPSGSLLVRQCPSGAACEWTFVNQGGDELPLEQVSHGLAELLAPLDPDDVSISYDGLWLALSIDGTVRIQSLDPETSTSAPTVIEPTGEGNSWSLVGWGSGSLSLSLVEIDPPGRPVRYATIDLRGGGVNIVDAPMPESYGAVADFAQGVQVSRRVPSGSTLSSYTTLVVPTSTDASLPMGEVTPFSDPLDVSGLLRSGETLAGPSGLLEVATPPDVTRDEVWPQATVFTRGGERVGLIELRGGAPSRLPVDPASGWRIVGSDRPGQVIEISNDNAGTSQIRARKGAGEIWNHKFSGAARWVIPGLLIHPQ